MCTRFKREIPFSVLALYKHLRINDANRSTNYATSKHAMQTETKTMQLQKHRNFKMTQIRSRRKMRQCKPGYYCISIHVAYTFWDNITGLAHRYNQYSPSLIFKILSQIRMLIECPKNPTNSPTKLLRK